MDKQTFCAILESALFSFDEVSEEKMIQKYGIEKRLAKAGIELCSYLKSINKYKQMSGHKTTSQ